MKKILKSTIFAICLCGLLTLGSCSIFQFANLLNCKFDMADISNITWAGINLSKVNSVKDLSMDNLKKAGKAIKTGDYKVSCSVNVNAKNETKRAAKLIGYDYQLFLDNMPLAEGSSKNNTYVIQPNSTLKIPVPVSIDIANIVKRGEIDNIINFVRNLKDCGNGTESKVQVKFTPYMNVGKESKKLTTITLNKTFQ